MVYVRFYLPVLFTFEDSSLKNIVLKQLLNLEKRQNLTVTYFEGMCEFRN